MLKTGKIQQTDKRRYFHFISKYNVVVILVSWCYFLYTQISILDHCVQNFLEKEHPTLNWRLCVFCTNTRQLSNDFLLPCSNSLAWGMLFPLRPTSSIKIKKFGGCTRSIRLVCIFTWFFLPRICIVFANYVCLVHLHLLSEMLQKRPRLALHRQVPVV